MQQARRLLTSIDVDGTEPGMAISALLELELVDGSRVTLLDDRGWSSSGGGRSAWGYTSLQQLTDTARTVVGPDEPAEGVSYDEEDARHWNQLAANARSHGVSLDAHDLAALPHDVVVSQEVRARVSSAGR